VKTISPVVTLKQGTCKSKSVIFNQYTYQLLHVGKETEQSRLPREVLKSVKRRKVRGKIKHFLKKSVPDSSVLFAVATSCKLWIVKLAHEEESFFARFFKQNLNKKSVGLLVGIISVIQNLCPSSVW